MGHMFDRLTNDELLKRTVAARIAAHDCRMNPYRENADGHRWVEIETNAWAERGREWAELANEVDRRSLRRPDLPLGYDGDSRRKAKPSSTATENGT
jgi:hypothetical protein